MELDEVFQNVCQIIETSTGFEKEKIKLESTIFDHLGIDSIDLVDILFEIETFYDIELKISDLEFQAKKELGDVPYEIEGIITKEGLNAIRKNMPEIDQNLLIEGLTVHRLVQLFTVHSLCKIILLRLSLNENLN
ncbi:MAG: acyl carrier protein [Flavobacteriia bacterium]|jgi:acyl carrier protein